jgi:hypothetical protein
MASIRKILTCPATLEDYTWFHLVQYQGSHSVTSRSSAFGQVHWDTGTDFPRGCFSLDRKQLVAGFVPQAYKVGKAHNLELEQE